MVANNLLCGILGIVVIGTLYPLGLASRDDR